MILFKDDWLRYPDAIADVNTTNKSWLEMSIKLKMMGIENHMWPLALMNPSLQGIDPFDEKLTLKQKADIVIECQQNPWYFFREVGRAPSKSGAESSRVECNRANLALWWCFFNHITYIAVQPRQTGKSLGADLLFSLLYTLYCLNTQLNLLTKDDKLRGETIDRVKKIYDEYPGYLKFKTALDVNNTEELSIKALGNTYKSHVPQASAKAAQKAARGFTSPIFLVDEAPFQPNIATALPAAFGSMGAAVEQAEAKGEPYGQLFTTTAGKKDDPDGKYIYEFIQEAALMSEHFYDARNQKELDKMVRSNSRGKDGVYRIYGCYNHRQLGKDDKWMKAKLELSNAKGEDADRDFFNIWTSGSETSPLDVEDLERFKNSIVAEDFQGISPIGTYIIRWYIPKDQLKEYMDTHKTIMSLDTSDASGGDDISLYILDVETGVTVGAGTYNRNNLMEFADWLVYLLETYVNSTMIIERKSSGPAIIDYLLRFLPLKGIDPFRRLFNWVVNDPHEFRTLYQEALLPMRKRSEDIYVRAKSYFGWATSSSGKTSRSELYSTGLQNATKRCADKAKDRVLVDQIMGLMIRNGRIDHGPGRHDDLVIGWLLAHWLITTGTNLIHYGIDPLRILIQVKKKTNLTKREEYLANDQVIIRQRIQTLYDRLSKETDNLMCERMEQELKALDTSIILQEGESYSLDAVLSSAKELRKKNNKGSMIHQSSGYARLSQGYVN